MKGISLFRAGVCAVLFPLFAARGPAERARAARGDQKAEFKSLLQFFHEDLQGRIGRAITVPVVSAVTDDDVDLSILVGEGFFGTLAAAGRSVTLSRVIEGIAGPRRRRCETAAAAAAATHSLLLSSSCGLRLQWQSHYCHSCCIRVCYTNSCVPAHCRCAGHLIKRHCSSA
jgi:hypothetical protein